MDAVNEINLPIRDERCTQVEELVKHQISRVEKILESSLARTASLIEQQMKRAREDEQKRQNIEKSKIIETSDDILEDKSSKTKHDIGIKENTEKTSSFLVCAKKSSKTFKSIGINTDAKIKFQSQSTDDEHMPKTQDQQLILSNSTADRKRQQFAGGKKIYKPKDTRPFWTISISVDQHLGRMSKNNEELKFENTSKCKQIVVRAPSSSSEMDVMVSADVVQENSVYLTTGSIESVETVFFNRSAVSNLSDVPQTLVSREYGKPAEKTAVDKDVLEYQTNSPMKECELEAEISKPNGLSTEFILNSNIDHNLFIDQIQKLGTEYDSSELSTTDRRIPSQSGEARIFQGSNCDASVSTDCYFNTRSKDNGRKKRHKRKVKKPIECRGSDSETCTSSTSNARLPIKVVKDSDFKYLRRSKEKRKSNVNFDQNKGQIVGVVSDNSQSKRQSAPELRYSRKEESTKRSDRKCFSEGHDRSYPNTRCDPSIRLRPSDLQERRISSEESKTIAHRQESVTDSGSDYKSQSSNNASIKKSRASKHSSRSISSHNDNTSCGLSRNLSKAAVTYQKLADENSLTECLPSLSSKVEQRVTQEQKDTIDGSVENETAIRYTLLADESTEKADELYLNQNIVCSEIEDPNGDVSLLKEVGENVTSEVIYASNEVEQENNLTLNKDESEQIHDCQMENIDADVSIDDNELPENDITVDNRRQSGRVSNVFDDKVSSTTNPLTAIRTDIKPEFTTELRISDEDKSCERTNPLALDDSSCTARSFEDKYHFVMDTLEKQLKATTASGDSHVAEESHVEIGLGQEKKNRRRSHSMNRNVSLDHSVGSCDELRNGPSSEPVRSKRKQRSQLESAFPCEITANENSNHQIRLSVNHETLQLGEEVFSTEQNSKHVDVSSSQCSFDLDDSSEYTLSNRSNEKQCKQESTINDSDVRFDDETSTSVISESEKNSNTKPLDITKDDSSVSIDYYSDIRTPLSCIVDSSELSPPLQTRKNQRVSNLKNKVVRDVGKSSSPDEIDSTDIESLDSSFYERSASRRDIITAKGDDCDVSFAAETSVSTAAGTANGTERTDDVSDNCLSVPVSLDYYSDLVTPVTSLRYVLDEWSEPVENPFKLKRKTKRLNRKKTITDVHVTLGGKHSQNTSAIHRSSTPCRDSKGVHVSIITNANEGDLVGNQSKIRASSIQYSPDLQRTQEQDCNGDSTTLSFGNNERALDSFRSSTSSCGGRPIEPFESSLPGRVDDEATTTEDVASSIFPEDVNDATDVDEQLQLDETDLSEVTDILGTSTETFTKIENPNYKPCVEVRL